METNGHFPLITAATCSWSHSDKINFQSMGEEIMLLEKMEQLQQFHQREQPTLLQI